jgi:hypothetical protein
MSCNFKIALKRDVNTVYQIAIQEIERFGAKYEGDETGGDFVLNVLGMRFKGFIEVESNIIVVNVTDKPLLVPCSFIESNVKKYVASLLQALS